MLPDEEVFVGAVVSITSIRDDPWIVVFVGSLISWSSPYVTHVAECYACCSVDHVEVEVTDYPYVIVSRRSVQRVRRVHYYVNAWLVTFGGLYSTTITHFVLFRWSSSITDYVFLVSSVLICRHGMSARKYASSPPPCWFRSYLKSR